MTKISPAYHVTRDGIKKHNPGILRSLKFIAFDYGKFAFKSGKMRVPAQDVNVLKIIKGNEIGDPMTKAIFKAWFDGWDTENLRKSSKPFVNRMENMPSSHHGEHTAQVRPR